MHELNIEQVTDRARATLWGLALGDAMGMPAEMWPTWRIREELGTITTFVPAPETNRTSVGLPAGSVTDDTNQALALARALIKHGAGFSSAALGQELLDWAKKKNLLTSPLLGDNTRAALLELDAGASVEDLANPGTTNGAVVRIPALGIVFPPDKPRALREAVFRACAPTHKTGLAVAGAGAVAAMISALIAGWSPKEAFDFALEQAGTLQASDREGFDPDLAKRVRLVVDLCRGRADAATFLYETFGTGREIIQTVPAAFALAFGADFDPNQATQAAANLGGDTDTIGAICGAICGAAGGLAAIDAARRQTLGQVNHLDLDQVAGELVQMRLSLSANDRTGQIETLSAAEVAAGKPWWETFGTDLATQARERQLDQPLSEKNRVIVLGGAIADVLVSVERLPEKGDDQPASQLAYNFGGCAFNILCNLKTLGYPATAAIAVGSGPWAQRARQAFAANNLTYSWQRLEEDNGWSLAMVLPDGEITFVSVAGVENHWYREELDQLNVGANDLLYLSGFELDALDAPVLTSWLEDTSPRLILDPGPRLVDRGPALLGELPHMCEVLTLNREEATTLFATPSPQVAADWAMDYGCSVILRMDRRGQEGAWLCTPLDDPVFFPAFTTCADHQGGAGDAHTSGVIAALAAGWPLDQATELGNLLAAAVVGKKTTHL